MANILETEKKVLAVSMLAEGNSIRAIERVTKLIWKGVVEVFTLASHPKAKRCFAWSHKAGKNDSDERFVAVLEIPPVTSPETAVKVAIVAEVKNKQ